MAASRSARARLELAHQDVRMVGEFLGLLHETLGHLPSLSGSPADHRKEHRAAV